MSDKKEQILAALKKLGPSSPLRISDSTGIEGSLCGYHLRAMAKAGTLKVSGKTSNRIYQLAGDKTSAPEPPPQKRSKPKSARPTAIENFLPAYTADDRLVLLNGGAPQIFNPQQTEAIATLLLSHFE